MKTRVAVYEEGLFDLRGAKLLRGANAPSRPPPLKETLPMLYGIGGQYPTHICVQKMESMSVTSSVCESKFETESSTKLDNLS